MEGMYPNITLSVVCLSLKFLEISNDSKGGRKILGLSSTLNVSRRVDKGIEVEPSGHHNVCHGRFSSRL